MEEDSPELKYQNEVDKKRLIIAVIFAMLVGIVVLVGTFCWVEYRTHDSDVYVIAIKHEIARCGLKTLGFDLNKINVMLKYSIDKIVKKMKGDWAMRKEISLDFEELSGMDCLPLVVGELDKMVRQMTTRCGVFLSNNSTPTMFCL